MKKILKKLTLKKKNIPQLNLQAISEDKFNKVVGGGCPCVECTCSRGTVALDASA